MAKILNRPEQKNFRQALRRNSTPAERVLWSVLGRDGLDGWKFRRQYGIGSYVVDFYCPEAQLAVEADGDSHFSPEGIAHDRTRDEFITSQGVRVIRFSNLEIRHDLERVVAVIRGELRNPT